MYVIRVVITGYNNSNFVGTYNYTIEELENADTVVKLKTVRVGASYYTIEDAILLGSGHIYVMYYTKFASVAALQRVYGLTSFTLGSGRQIALPKQNITNYTAALTHSNASYHTRVVRGAEYSRLVVTSGVSLTVQGEIIVDANRGVISTNWTGIVSGTAYGVIYLEEDSHITITSGGKYSIYGFSTGEGQVTALSGAVVTEFMSIFDYKGGTITTDVTTNKLFSIPTGQKSDKPFPFNYFVPAAISNKILVNPGVVYKITGFVTASSNNFVSSVDLIGPSGVFNLTSGSIVKEVVKGRVKLVTTYGTNVNLLGKMSLTVSQGLTLTLTFNANVNTYEASSEIPFGAFYDIEIRNNSTFTITAPMNLLSGSTLLIDGTSTLNINHGLFIAGSNEYTGIAQDITNNSSNTKEGYYDRDFTYDITQPSQFIALPGSIINFGSGSLARIGGTLSYGVTYNFVGLTAAKLSTVVRKILPNGSKGTVSKVTFKLKNPDGTDYVIS